MPKLLCMCPHYCPQGLSVSAIASPSAPQQATATGHCSGIGLSESLAEVVGFPSAAADGERPPVAVRWIGKPSRPLGVTVTGSFLWRRPAKS
jgi:hypothetical protein